MTYILQDERTFTEDEEEKLQASLGLDGADLELVLQTLEFFLQQVCNKYTYSIYLFSDWLKDWFCIYQEFLGLFDFKSFSLVF